MYPYHEENVLCFLGWTKVRLWRRLFEAVIQMISLSATVLKCDATGTQQLSMTSILIKLKGKVEVVYSAILRFDAQNWNPQLTILMSFGWRKITSPNFNKGSGVTAML